MAWAEKGINALANTGRIRAECVFCDPRKEMSLECCIIVPVTCALHSVLDHATSGNSLLQ